MVTATATACYLYCVVPGDDGPATAQMTAVDPAHPVVTLRCGPVAALMSQVSLTDFGPEALKRRFEDITWLETVARRHDAVLSQALDAGAVVPLRLCTIFDDEARALRMLERSGPLLQENLARLAGRREWGVKVMGIRARSGAPDRERGGGRGDSSTAATGQSPGHAFFARKRQQATAARQSEEAMSRAVEEIDRHLRAHATAAVVLPAQHRDLSKRAGDMLFNGAYLVDRAHEDAFAQAARVSDERYTDAGVRVELAGPFAPYNFVSSPEASDE
jgi:hypothetical protein